MYETTHAGTWWLDTWKKKIEASAEKRHLRVQKRRSGKQKMASRDPNSSEDIAGTVKDPVSSLRQRSPRNRIQLRRPA